MLTEDPLHDLIDLTVDLSAYLDELEAALIAWVA